MLNYHSYELVGEGIHRALADYHPDLLLLGCSGVTLEFGFCVRDEPEAAAAHALCGSASRVWVLADHSKLGKHTFARFAALSSVAGLITDVGADPHYLAKLQEAGLYVHIAPLP